MGKSSFRPNILRPHGSVFGGRAQSWVWTSPSLLVAHTRAGRRISSAYVTGAAGEGERVHIRARCPWSGMQEQQVSAGPCPRTRGPAGEQVRPASRGPGSAPPRVRCLEKAGKTGEDLRSLKPADFHLRLVVRQLRACSTQTPPRPTSWGKIVGPEGPPGALKNKQTRGNI